MRNFFLHAIMRFRISINGNSVGRKFCSRRELNIRSILVKISVKESTLNFKFNFWTSPQNIFSPWLSTEDSADNKTENLVDYKTENSNKKFKIDNEEMINFNLKTFILFASWMKPLQYFNISITLLNFLLCVFCVCLLKTT